jgi:hypothetical protein
MALALGSLAYEIALKGRPWAMVLSRFAAKHPEASLNVNPVLISQQTGSSVLDGGYVGTVMIDDGVQLVWVGAPGAVLRMNFHRCKDKTVERLRLEHY